jgi:hypothetical protein
LSLLILFPQNLRAADIWFGGAAWYVWYEASSSSEKLDPAILYGPALSVRFNDDFNLTFVYYYGKFEYNYGRVSERHDSDIALNYRLNDYFKVFAGAKYRKVKTDSNEGSNPPVVINSIKTDSIGPGLGLTLTLPLTDNLYILGTGSGLLLWRKSEYDLGYEQDSLDHNNYGYNTTLGLVYYIAPISTVINLGGRYQCLMEKKDTSIKDTYYGVTLTATYYFEI